MKPIVNIKAVNMVKNELVQDDDTGQFYIKQVNVGYEIRYQREGDDTWYEIGVEQETVKETDDTVQ